MAWRVEQNDQTGLPEIIIDGWEKGIADSPYTGLTSILNLNTHYYPGALYSNYKRSRADTGLTIGTLAPYLFTSTNPSGTSAVALGNNTFINTQYIIADQSGNTFAASGTANFAALSSHAIPNNSGNNITGICYYSPIYNSQQGTGNQWMFGWGQSNVDNYNTMYYAEYSAGAWGAWTEFAQWKSSLFPTIVTAGTPNYAIWGGNLNKMYICNGPYIMTLSYAIDTFGNLNFNPGGTSGTDYLWGPATAITGYGSGVACILPFYENAIWLGEWNTNMLIASGNRLYVWDETASTPSSFIQFPEPVNKFIVVNNTIFVLAGYKGNIYSSNGYSVSLFKKIPDSFFGQTDPQLVWGGLMFKRNKIYVGVSTTTETGSSGYISGVFSINIDTGEFGFEQAGALNFENQNSFGLYASTAPNVGQPLILFDSNYAATDFYYSAWTNNTTNAFDKSATGIYTSGETVFETDLVPVGQYLTQSTPANVEFKLDAPLASGDTVQILGRQHFTDSYTSFGTYTSDGTQLSSEFPTAIQGLQWLQIKVIITTTSATVVRLREIRVRMNQ